VGHFPLDGERGGSEILQKIEKVPGTLILNDHFNRNLVRRVPASPERFCPPNNSDFQLIPLSSEFLTFKVGSKKKESFDFRKPVTLDQIPPKKCKNQWFHFEQAKNCLFFDPLLYSLLPGDDNFPRTVAVYLSKRIAPDSP